jgi:hypothetical protein
MKRTKILYWVITILFAAFMLFSAIPNVMVNEDSVKLISDYLHYPEYFIPFIGIAKVLGAIVILIPGLKRLKEWAYAGLFFDLAGATYSIIYISGITVDIIFMVLPIVFLFISYFLWQKTISDKQ